MKRIIYHSLSLFVWVYATFKLFIFDIDLYLVEEFIPHLKWISKYRFVFLIPIVALLWSILGNKEFRKLFFFVLFYPVILFLWTIPFDLIAFRKQWFMLFAYISGVISFFKNLKVNLAYLSILIICTFTLVTSNNVYLLNAVIAVLLMLAFYLLFRKGYYVFQPSAIFSIRTEKLVNYLEQNKLSELFESKKDKKVEERDFTSEPEQIEIIQNEKTEDPENESDVKPYTSLLLINRTLHFFTVKLSEFKKSRVYMSLMLLSVLGTFLFSILIFSLINYSIYKIEPAAFELTNDSFAMFFYYSLNSMCQLP